MKDRWINSRRLMRHILNIKQLSHGDTTVQSALGQAVTVQSQITPLFNKNTSYAQFLVSAVIPALWQIMIVVGTILVLTANVRARGLHAWLSNTPMKSLASTLTPYLVLFLMFGITFSFWFYVLLDWPFNGNFEFACGFIELGCR